MTSLSLNPLNTINTSSSSLQESFGSFMSYPVKYLGGLDLRGLSFIGKAATITAVALAILVVCAGIYLAYKSIKEWIQREKSSNPDPTQDQPKPIQKKPIEEKKPAPIQDQEKPKETNKSTKVQVRLANGNVRNIIIVGKLHSGKSTITSVLQSIFKICTMESLFPTTRQPQLYTTDIDQYKLNLIDTPGLCEVDNPNGEKKRDNKEIIKLIKNVAKDNFGGDDGFENVDVALITIAYGSQGINPEDVDSMNALLPELTNTKKIIVITHAEALDQNDRARLIDELSRHNLTKDFIANHFNKKDSILFSGALTSDCMLGPDKLNAVLENLKNDREALIAAILPKEEDPVLKQARMETLDKNIKEFKVAAEEKAAVIRESKANSGSSVKKFVMPRLNR